MRLAQHSVREQPDLGTKQRTSRDLEVGGVESVPVFRHMPNQSARRGVPKFADAVLAGEAP